MLMQPRLLSPNNFGFRDRDRQVDKFTLYGNNLNHHIVADANSLTYNASEVSHSTLPLNALDRLLNLKLVDDFCRWHYTASRLFVLAVSYLHVFE